MAKFMGWVPQVCHSNTATFLLCSITGILSLYHVKYNVKRNIFAHTKFSELHPELVYDEQLPAQQLEKALSKHPNLRAPLTAYASKPNVRNVLPR
jgi:hypothetical protein